MNEALNSLLTLLGLIFASVGIFVAALFLWLRNTLRGEE